MENIKKHVAYYRVSTSRQTIYFTFYAVDKMVIASFDFH